MTEAKLNNSLWSQRHPISRQLGVFCYDFGEVSLRYNDNALYRGECSNSRNDAAQFQPWTPISHSIFRDLSISIAVFVNKTTIGSDDGLSYSQRQVVI